MPVLLGIASFAVDYARVRLVHDELAAAAETAARYAVLGLSDGTAVTRAITAAGNNTVDNSAMTLQAGDVTTGVWDPVAHTFTATAINPNAVSVVATRCKTRGNAVPLLFLQALGMSSADAQATVVAYYTNDALLVVGAVPLSTSDQMFADRLTGLGLNVVAVRDSSVTALQAQAARVVVISESVTSGNVGNRLKAVSIGCVIGEPLLFDDYQMTGTTAQTDMGYTTVGNNVSMAGTSHPLACGLTGTVTVTTHAASISYGLGFGVPAASAVVIADVSGQPGKAALFCYDTGDVMDSGYVANGRRVGFFGYSPSGASDGTPASCLNANGWSMFDASVTWALASSAPVRSVRFTR